MRNYAQLSEVLPSYCLATPVCELVEHRRTVEMIQRL